MNKLFNGFKVLKNEIQDVPRSDGTISKTPTIETRAKIANIGDRVSLNRNGQAQVSIGVINENGNTYPGVALISTLSFTAVSNTGDEVQKEYASDDDRIVKIGTRRVVNGVNPTWSWNQDSEFDFTIRKLPMREGDTEQKYIIQLNLVGNTMKEDSSNPFDSFFAEANTKVGAQVS